MNTGRIEKTVLLRATRERVWRAPTDSKEFGSWFGVKFDEPFTPGARLRGAISPTTVDAEVAKMQKPYEGKPFEIAIEEIRPRADSLSDGILTPLTRASIIQLSQRPLSSSNSRMQRVASC